MSNIGSIKNEYGTFWQHNLNKMRLQALLAEVRSLRENIKQFEERNKSKVRN